MREREEAIVSKWKSTGKGKGGWMSLDQPVKISGRTGSFNSINLVIVVMVAMVVMGLMALWCTSTRAL